MPPYPLHPKQKLPNIPNNYKTQPLVCIQKSEETVKETVEDKKKNIKYLDQISGNNTIYKVQEDVMGEFWVALDSKHVISIAEHLNCCHFRPSYHLCFRREL